MCLAIPAEIVELLDDGMARVNLGGVTKDVSITLIEEPAVGEYVIVHVGYALSKVDAEEAEKTLALFAEMDEAMGLEVTP